MVLVNIVLLLLLYKVVVGLAAIWWTAVVAWVLRSDVHNNAGVVNVRRRRWSRRQQNRTRLGRTDNTTTIVEGWRHRGGRCAQNVLERRDVAST